MGQEEPRPGGDRGADQNALWGADSGSKNYILIDPPCTCHLRQPCWVCRAWWTHYQHTQLAAAAIRHKEVRP
jgi:hypothetical protein